jgi:hypothetical protein
MLNLHPMNITYYFGIADIVSIIIPIIVGIRYFKQINYEAKVFLGLLLLVGVSNLIIRHFALKGINSAVYSSFYHINVHSFIFRIPPEVLFAPKLAF